MKRERLRWSVWCVSLLDVVNINGLVLIRGKEERDHANVG